MFSQAYLEGVAQSYSGQADGDARGDKPGGRKASGSYDEQRASLKPDKQPSFEDQVARAAPRFKGAPIATATTKVGLNVRRGPSTRHDKVDRLSKGTTVDVLAGAAGGWLKVRHGGDVRYVYGGRRYVSYHADGGPRSEAMTRVKRHSATEGASVDDKVALEVFWQFVALCERLMEKWGTPSPDEEEQEAAPEEEAKSESKTTLAGKPEQEEAAPSEGDEKPAARGRLYEVVDGKAYIRSGKRLKSTGKIIPKGTKVYIVATRRMKAKVVTPAGEAHPITDADDVWTSQGNLGGTGRDVGLGNERTDAKDAAKAKDLIAGLPTGRRPGLSPYKWKYGSHRSSMDGISIKSGLWSKVTRMLEWAIQNDMLAGNVKVDDGMRSPKAAHRISVAWEIQYGQTPSAYYRRVKQLPGGRDADGNLWYKPGWSADDVKAHANSVRSKKVKAIGGYENGNPKRAPHAVNGKPGVSRHCTGRAVDVTIPWRRKGVDATRNKSDDWGWEEIYRMFGLYRPLKKGSKYAESWHIEETGKKIDDEGGSPVPNP